MTLQLRKVLKTSRLKLKKFACRSYLQLELNDQHLSLSNESQRAFCAFVTLTYFTIPIIRKVSKLTQLKICNFLIQLTYNLIIQQYKNFVNNFYIKNINFISITRFALVNLLFSKVSVSSDFMGFGEHSNSTTMS